MYQRGEDSLLLFSYVLAAALELAMTVKSFQAGNFSFAWSFGFLLLLSGASIPLETSSMGKMVRTEFKNLGIDTKKYDLISNLGRSGAYLLIVGNILSSFTGLILAYLITFVMLIAAIYKFKKGEK